MGGFVKGRIAKSRRLDGRTIPLPSGFVPRHVIMRRKCNIPASNKQIAWLERPAYGSAMIPTPLLDSINDPADLRRLKASELRQLAQELRAETIDAAATSGGHFGAGLGVVELTVALHYVFDTPSDRLIWDVSHQSYPHKILTGRRDRIRQIRQRDGLYGFTKRTESAYDPFGAAHSSTSISAGLGMAVARDLEQRDNQVICVIGDGAMSAGMAYEAMNNAGALDTRLIVVLNDNGMSIAPAVGALTNYLSWLVSSRPFLSLRDIAKQLARKFPRSLRTAARRADEYARGMLTGGTLFEELGFYYVGPDRRPQYRYAGSDPAECARRQAAGPGTRPRSDGERQGPSLRQARPGKIPCHLQVRPRDPGNGREHLQCAKLTRRSFRRR